MSPEQLTESDLTPASDIYSLGVVVFELLFGENALPGNSWMAQFDRLQTGYVFSAQDVERVPPHLRAIVDKMTARDPSERYRSVRQIQSDLLGPRHAPTEAIPMPASHPGVPDTAPRTLTITIAVLGLVAIAIAIAILVFGDTTPTSPPPKRVTPVAAPAPAPAPAVPVAQAPTDVRHADIPDFGSEIEPIAPIAWESPGCGSQPQYIGRGQLERAKYRDSSIVYVPKRYDPSRKHPLLILIHQTGETPSEILTTTGFDKVADRDGVIIAVPEGPESLTTAWPASRDHVDRMRAEVVDIDTQLCIDHTRIYVVSNGGAGHVAMTLAVEPWTAAIATHNYRARESDFPMERRLAPMIMFAGKQDKVYPIHGGHGCLDVGEQFAKKSHAWHVKEAMTHFKCGGEEQTHREESTGKCITWACDRWFVSCELDGGHPWANGKPRKLKWVGLLTDTEACDGQPADFPTTETIWAFLRTKSVDDR